MIGTILITTKEAFKMPAINSRTEIYVDSYAGLIPNCWIWNSSVGYLKVISYNYESGYALVENLGIDNNAEANTLFPSCMSFIISAPVNLGDTGADACLESDFVCPTDGNTSIMSVSSTENFRADYLISLNGYVYLVEEILTSTTMRVLNDGQGGTGTVEAPCDGTCIGVNVVSDTSACAKDVSTVPSSIIGCYSGNVAAVKGTEDGQVLNWTGSNWELLNSNLESDCTILTTDLTLNIGNTGPYLIFVNSTEMFSIGTRISLGDTEDGFVVTEIVSTTSMRITVNVAPTEVTVYFANTRLCVVRCCDWLPTYVDNEISELSDSKEDAFTKGTLSASDTNNNNILTVVNGTNCLVTNNATVVLDADLGLYDNSNSGFLNYTIFDAEHTWTASQLFSYINTNFITISGNQHIDGVGSIYFRDSGGDVSASISSDRIYKTLTLSAYCGTVLDLSSTNIVSTGNFIPKTTATYSLGSTTNYWTNLYATTIDATTYNVSGSAFGLPNLGDVTITNLVAGQVIQYDGTDWKNITLTGVSTTWGSIAGSISNQTDLSTALADKASLTSSNTFSAAQTFSSSINGTTGNFSGAITANGDITKTTANTYLTLNAPYGVILNAYGTDKVVCDGSSLRPIGNAITVLGASNFRWSNVYSTQGNFSSDVNIKQVIPYDSTSNCGLFNNRFDYVCGNHGNFITDCTAGSYLMYGTSIGMTYANPVLTLGNPPYIDYKCTLSHNFYINGVNNLQILSGCMRPVTTETCSLGEYNYRWDCVYGLDGHFTDSVTAYHLFGDGIRLYMHNNFVPTATDTLNLGSNALKWDCIYLRNQPVVGSDLRLKKNILELGNSLDKINTLRPIKYDFKTDETNNSDRVGFVAQEVKEVIPEIVEGEATESDTLGLRTADLIPFLTKAIQELSNKITTLEEEIRILKGE